MFGCRHAHQGAGSGSGTRDAYEGDCTGAELLPQGRRERPRALCFVANGRGKLGPSAPSLRTAPRLPLSFLLPARGSRCTQPKVYEATARGGR